MIEDTVTAAQLTLLQWQGWQIIDEGGGKSCAADHPAFANVAPCL
jgi:hypothetical protein